MHHTDVPAGRRSLFAVRRSRIPVVAEIRKHDISVIIPSVLFLLYHGNINHCRARTRPRPPDNYVHCVPSNKIIIVRRCARRSKNIVPSSRGAPRKPPEFLKNFFFSLFSPLNGFFFGFIRVIRTSNSSIGSALPRVPAGRSCVVRGEFVFCLFVFFFGFVFSLICSSLRILIDSRD